MDLIDYLEWRGDLPFSKSAFCDVDALILCQLSYLDFDGLLSADFSKKTSVKDLWAAFKSSPDFKKRCDLGALISQRTVRLLELCAASARFGKLFMSGYVSKIDLQNEEQFSAVAFFEKPRSANPFVAFRGTDDTIVGWKEDFNLAIEESVPAQRDALAYLEGAAKKTRGKILVGGHSKGGNLAVYSSAFVAPKVQRRLERVYNFDGPGFRREIIEDARLKKILPLLRRAPLRRLKALTRPAIYFTRLSTNGLKAWTKKSEALLWRLCSKSLRQAAPRPTAIWERIGPSRPPRL